jgi:hypothetical protein
MSESEVSLWGKSLLAKIHVITGWVIPDGELLTILIDQFQKKLVESYPDMNVDEIEYAFRQGGTTVEDWGKSMNLALLDKVLIDYLGERKRLSHTLEERNVPPPVQVLLTDDQLDDLYREDVENFYQRLRYGRTTNDVPKYFKDILVKDGLLKQDDDATQFFVDRLGRGSENIYIKQL